jgi:hypothetical protein
MPVYQGFRGLNTLDPETRLGLDELREALNIDIDKTGLVRRRAGYSVINSGKAHSLWADDDLCLFVRGSELRSLQGDDSDTLIASGLNLNAPLSYEAVNGEVYWCNGYQRGVIRGGINHAWGLPIPGSPTLTLLPGGGLPAGKYQACATLVDSTGREGPAGKAVSITLATPQAIELTLHSGLSHPGIAQANIYLTPANGDKFYLAGIATTSAPNLLISGGYYTIALRTQYLSSPPSGHLVRYYRGRLWIAQENILWFTDALGYHLVDAKRGFFLLPASIDVLEPVVDGFFIAADKTYFLSGAQPDEMVLSEVASFGAIRGTSVRVDGSHVKTEQGPMQGPVVLWTSPKGICAGASQGIFINLTESKVALDAAQVGAGLFREQDGLRQYLSLLKKQGDADSLKTNDRFSATIIRQSAAP